MRYRLWATGMLLASATNLAIGASDSTTSQEPSDWKRITLQDHGSIELPAPSGWKMDSKNPSPGMFPTIQFSPPEGNAFSVLITPIWGQPADRGFNQPDKVLKIVKLARDKAAESATSPHIDIVEIHGGHLVGYYFTATDRSPKPDEWKYMTHGSAAFDDLLVEFTILSNDPKQPEAAATLAMLQKARRGTD